MKRQWSVLFIPAGMFTLGGLLPCGCEERDENSPAQQPRLVQSEPVQANAMDTTPGPTPRSKTDFWGQPVDHVGQAVSKEPNFWDLSTWRLDFWNPPPPSPDPAMMTSNNKSLDKLVDFHRRQLEYQKKHGSGPVPQTTDPKNPPQPGEPVRATAPTGG